MMYTQRYTRQTVLPEIGEAGQTRLADACVLCVGAGGLGAPVLHYLAAAGVGHIGIMDPDTVDLGNLQRQVLFCEDDIGAPKASRAGQHIAALNSDIHIEAYDTALSPDNAPEIIPAYDIIIDGTDNFAAKFLINDAAVKYDRPFIYGAIQGFDGQACVFDAASGPCYRCLYPEMPKARIANCAESGVIGTVAGLVGMTQALQAIQLITGDASFKPLKGRLWTLDTKTMASHTLAVPKNGECPVCSQPSGAITLASEATAACATVPELHPEQLSDYGEAVLIDIRESEELASGAIEGARHHPFSAFLEGYLPDLPANRDIILHCQHGIRSIQAAQMLQARGFEAVYSLKGGYAAWAGEE